MSYKVEKLGVSVTSDSLPYPRSARNRGIFSLGLNAISKGKDGVFAQGDNVLADGENGTVAKEVINKSEFEIMSSDTISISSV